MKMEQYQKERPRNSGHFYFLKVSDYMKKLTAKAWWTAATVRAIKTAAQAFIGACGTIAVIYQLDWRVVAGTTIMAAVLSYATSLAGLPEVN